MTVESVTIVGASLAGLRAAQSLRGDGFSGPITVFGDETRPPYDRPPLSKQVLAGEWEPERTVLASDEKLAELDLDLRLGVRAVGFSLADRTLTLDGGDESLISVDGLVIATGARCRTLPGTEGVDGVFVLRTLDDCLALRAAFDSDPGRVVVIGAGFIGAEVAATARERGLPVTLVEAEATPLARVLGERIGEICAEVHRDHGVDLRTGVGVAGIDADERVTGVTLADGTRVEADVVVVGIGVVPNTDWLEGSGIDIGDGVLCDATCLAADRVVAAGDVARWPNRLFDEVMRVEHWDNAVDQGTYAGRRLLRTAAEAEPFTPVPWFWSDQYDRKIQLAGRAGPDDRIEIVDGSVDERRFAALYGRGDRLVGVLGFNRPRKVMQYRELIEQGKSFDEALAADL